MRIGIIAPPWMSVPPAGYGGTESVIDRLARGFHTEGHDVLLWTTGDSTCPVPRGHVLPRARPEVIGSTAVEAQHVVCGYAAMAAWGADVVHDHTLIGPLQACRYPELRVVTTNHGPFEEPLSSLYRTTAATVPLVAISHDQRHHALGIPVAAVIHHGLDPEEFPVGDGAGDDEGPYLCTLARMAPEKGVDHAARAARDSGARLLIAAKMTEPAEHAWFEEAVEPLLGGGVRYVGELDLAGKVALLRGARALVNPIRWSEPFGLVMIESLACGTPVLAYPNGAAPEIVDHGDTGFLCHGLPDLTERLSDIDTLDRAACRSAVEARFTTSRMVRDHLALFSSLLAARAVA